ncbi:3-hydroxyacyl-CoA dehydrogenase family protein [Streptomyces sp. RS2]|uniref:3-hydroxyacyl-CoA dehydrogenase family protein n=1 Tax=Streptomyces sp. RS2 TaxID=1451205 RepID=UPI0021F8B974|nr:3-hydroxyacyl-CoA dehydrogenase family protein [Streptomyces sp. RS2]MCW1100245.1 3-hydroxyacyl-CoA dehydrogenase family protein [Streptomyces sp. RS2]
MSDFPRVAVLGFGTMGVGIAQVVAQSGRQVTVLEASRERVDAGLAAMSDFLSGGVRRGKLTAEQREDVLARVRGTTEVGHLADSDLVIEAVTERPDIKRALLSRVADVVSHDTVLTTNTSALSVTGLATAVPHSGRFAGLHFFNPAPLMRVVEVVHALQTDPKVVVRLAEFTATIGKDPVVVKDRPGFLVNRLLMPYLNDVIQAYDDELASAEDIDTAVRLGLGHKLGPLELLDLIGLDVHQHATLSAYEATFDPCFAPPPLLTHMVAAGRHGAKNGHGFRSTDKDA